VAPVVGAADQALDAVFEQCLVEPGYGAVETEAGLQKKEKLDWMLGIGDGDWALFLRDVLLTFATWRETRSIDGTIPSVRALECRLRDPA